MDATTFFGLTPEVRRATLHSPEGLEMCGRWSEIIVSWCRRRGLQSADAEDVSQELLPRLLGENFVYEPGRGIGPLLRVMTNRAVCDFVRKRNSRSAALTRYADLIDRQATDQLADLLLEREERDQLSAALGAAEREFSPRDFGIFRAKRFDGRTAPEIAGETGLECGEVYRIVARVSDFVKSELRRSSGEEQT